MAEGDGFLQVCSVAANGLNKHSRTGANWCFSNLGIVRRVHNFMEVRYIRHISRMGKLRKEKKMLTTKAQSKRSFQGLGIDRNILNYS
jgi:hypothetical protein